MRGKRLKKKNILLLTRDEGKKIGKKIRIMSTCVSVSKGKLTELIILRAKA
jgi:hypothetical protein